MRYYFKKVTDNISTSRLASYELGLAIIVTLCFYTIADSPRTLSFSKLFLQITTAAYAITAGKDLIQEMINEKKCNTYDLLRTIFSAVLFIISITCIDAIFSTNIQ